MKKITLLLASLIFVGSMSSVSHGMYGPALEEMLRWSPDEQELPEERYHLGTPQQDIEDSTVVLDFLDGLEVTKGLGSIIEWFLFCKDNDQYYE